MKPLLRIWHFFRGHPVETTWFLVGDEVGPAGEMQCESCGKEGKRL